MAYQIKIDYKLRQKEHVDQLSLSSNKIIRRGRELLALWQM